MAALVVQSRFAGLKIEDDDLPSSAPDAQKVKKNKNNTATATCAKKPELPKKAKSNTNKSQNGSSQIKKKKVKPTATAEQWELWKQKDEELVDGNFECELQQAILLSKLDYEEKKDVYKQIKKEAELKKKTQEQTRANGKKQKKKNVMSLDQFNDMISNGDDPKCSHIDDKVITETEKIPERDTEFFERVQDEAKNELLKDKIIERVRHRQPLSDEVINRVQFAEALERKDKEIAVLKQEVTSLKDELVRVKTRNKKLCNILGQGEMKDKAEVLVEVERLRLAQTELTAELATLHSELERERSRNTDPRAKDKKRKGGGTDKDK